jgi:hypothetical protein
MSRNALIFNRLFLAVRRFAARRRDIAAAPVQNTVFSGADGGLTGRTIVQ